MSLRIVQPSGEATSGSTGSPWAFCHGAEITADFPMCVLVTVKVPLRGLAGAAALKIASIKECVSVDVTAVKETSAFMSFRFANSQD